MPASGVCRSADELDCDEDAADEETNKLFGGLVALGFEVLPKSSGFVVDEAGGWIQNDGNKVDDPACPVPLCCL